MFTIYQVRVWYFLFFWKIILHWDHNSDSSQRVWNRNYSWRHLNFGPHVWSGGCSESGGSTNPLEIGKYSLFCLYSSMIHQKCAESLFLSLFLIPLVLSIPSEYIRRLVGTFPSVIFCGVRGDNMSILYKTWLPLKLTKSLHLQKCSIAATVREQIYNTKSFFITKREEGVSVKTNITLGLFVNNIQFLFRVMGAPPCHNNSL